MLPTKKLICWSCKEEVEVAVKPTRNDTCPRCDQPVKCCYNCKFYDRNANQQCLEPQAEWVRYKEKANFCEYFTLRVPVSATPAPPPQEVPTNNANNNNNNNRGNRTRSRSNNQNSMDQAPKKDKTKAAWDSLFKE